MKKYIFYFIAFSLLSLPTSASIIKSSKNVNISVSFQNSEFERISNSPYQYRSSIYENFSDSRFTELKILANRFLQNPNTGSLKINYDYSLSTSMTGIVHGMVPDGYRVEGTGLGYTTFQSLIGSVNDGKVDRIYNIPDHTNTIFDIRGNRVFYFNKTNSIAESHNLGQVDQFGISISGYYDLFTPSYLIRETVNPETGETITETLNYTSGRLTLNALNKLSGTVNLKASFADPVSQPYYSPADKQRAGVLASAANVSSKTWSTLSSIFSFAKDAGNALAKAALKAVIVPTTKEICEISNNKESCLNSVDNISYGASTIETISKLKSLNPADVGAYVLDVMSKVNNVMAQEFRDIANDPPNFDYTNISDVSYTSIALEPHDQLSEYQNQIINDIVNTQLLMSNWLNVALDSMEKYQGAAYSGDEYWAQKNLNQYYYALEQYNSLSSTLNSLYAQANTMLENLGVYDFLANTDVNALYEQMLFDMTDYLYQDQIDSVLSDLLADMDISKDTLASYISFSEIDVSNISNINTSFNSVSDVFLSSGLEFDDANSVPEPSTLILIALSLVLLRINRKS